MISIDIFASREPRSRLAQPRVHVSGNGVLKITDDVTVFVDLDDVAYLDALAAAATELATQMRAAEELV